MSTLHVVVGIDDKGEEVFDKFEDLVLSFITEPSGVLSIMRGEYLSAAYAPGAWSVVREPSEEES